MRICYSIQKMSDHEIVIENQTRPLLAHNAPYVAVDMDSKIIVVKVVNCKDTLQGALVIEIPKASK